MVHLELISRQPTQRRFPAPLLFVHGSNSGAWVWDRYFLPHFAGLGFEAHAVSLRGHGDSGGRDTLQWASIADYVADVAAAVERIGRPPVLIGHSMGAIVVQKYLQDNQAPAMALLAPVPPDGLIESWLLLAWRDPQLFWEISLVQSLGPQAATFATMRRALFADSTPDDFVRPYFANVQLESPRAIMDLMGLDLPRLDLVKARNGRMPVLVLGAEEDAFFPPRQVAKAAKAFRVKSRLLPMGHAMMLEPNWQVAADGLRDWLLADVTPRLSGTVAADGEAPVVKAKRKPKPKPKAQKPTPEEVAD